MKKLFLPLMILLLAFSAKAQELNKIQDGIEHAQITRKVKISDTENAPVVVNLLRLDLTKTRLDVVHAMDAAIGAEKTSSIATRHGAVAAINAGYFRLDGIFRGDASGVLQIDGKLLSESFGNRIALGVLNGKDKTEIEFGHLKAYKIVGFGTDSEFVFSGINRERKINEIILYTADFHRTTLTNADGTEIILSDCSMRCRKVEVVESKGSSIIPPDGYVISIGKDALEKSNNILYFAKRRQSNSKEMEIFRLAKQLDLSETSKKSFFNKVEDIVGGNPQLVKNGKVEITWREEKSGEKHVNERHPRTAIARLKDGRALLVTVDGRQAGVSAGMNLQELAEMLVEFNASDAMNLDGGGSTAMFLNGKVVNKPSDKEGERAVSDAILVFPRKKNL
ncbi:MAG TPA: phosphodiester glycosidase family protein [Pyrinomonadaceae bacterium]|nr:phosphodiester glycosidase family protein [Pyrinomonadaceae bacterium]